MEVTAGGQVPVGGGEFPRSCIPSATTRAGKPVRVRDSRGFVTGYECGGVVVFEAPAAKP